MEDDPVLLEALEAQGALGWEAIAACIEDLAVASRVKVMAKVMAGVTPWLWSSQRQRQGQGVAPSHQFGPSGQGHKDQTPGGGSISSSCQSRNLRSMTFS